MRAWIDFEFEIYEMHPETDGEAPGKSIEIAEILNE